jgi:2,5-dichlorohydroquinone reductive dechlorinase
MVSIARSFDNLELSSLVKELRAELGQPVAEPPSGAEMPPRFELFHAANSICSQKVRAVLAFHHLPYIEHSLKIADGQTYLPNHVRLRMIGCRRIFAPLASHHNGSTSATSSGCDAAVVPTLIDWASDDVIVDSKRICQYIDDRSAGPVKLRPEGIAARVDAELTIVDNLPNYQMLVGRRPDGAPTPTMHMGGGGSGFSLGKVERCRNYLQKYADDPALVEAYTAKLNKEKDAAETLFTRESMLQAYARAEAACAVLEARLASRTSTWLIGETFTMADLFWAVELLRMNNLGAGSFWEQGRLPQLAQYFRICESQPAIRAAIVDWPGALFS